METAQAYDNKTTRVAYIYDTARPWVAMKPKGYINRIIGHYKTAKGAQAAADAWNKDNAA